MNRRESGTFSIVPHAVLEAMSDRRLSPQAVALYAVLAKHADRQTGQSWPSRARLAKSLGYTKADSIDKYMTQLEDAGFVRVDARYGNRPDSVSEVRDAAHRGRLNNLYTLVAAPVASPASGGKGYPAQRARVTRDGGEGVARQRGYEQEALQQDPKTTGAWPAAAGARPAALPSWLVSVNRPEDVSPFAPSKRPLPGNWRPKADEQDQARRLGLDVGALEGQFRELMTGHERQEWDTTFEYFINDVAAQRDKENLPMSA
ncbi:hypothetical protein JMUB6875_42440 [Nocardia sp. JMUB6875]|uniref:helix-turn-helix domain-containing protein n=1 Tax=Nocardia sp. JMUB6875 TaxID=3158170 RepID=UPI0032E657DB